MSAQARVIVFCGKGGVGKSTLSLAMGLKLAKAGRRVLVVSSHPLPELAVGISLNGLSARFPEAAKRLFVVHIDPVEQISELVQKHFPMAMVAKAVLNSSIFQNLISIAPGLKEFFFLARLQQLAERKSPEDAGTPSYDDLIWDAPATGHFLTTLRAAKGFDTYLSGPLATTGAELHRFFSAPDNLRLVAVTQPEDMAIAETLDLAAGLARDFQIAPAIVVLNAVSPLCTADPHAIAEIESAPHTGAMTFAIDRGRAERAMCHQLALDLPAPQVFIPRLAHRDDDRRDADLDLLDEVGSWLDTALFT
ncbi:MAG: hypothetical protein JWN34_3081 [Bryobacterales bacterium]|nr:hypothetical protein [Bryobacterales bacterium]